MTSDCPYETIELSGLSLEVPRDWQIVRHGLDERKGRLTFTDRFEERMSLHWNALDREPDIPRMLQAEWRKSKGDSEMDDLSEVSVGDWKGFRADDARGKWLRAVRYDPDSRRLLEVALALRGSHSRSRPVEEQMLSRVKVNGREAMSRFLAFDLDVTYPSNFVATKAEVVPASVTLHLEARATTKRFGIADSVLIRRMGMARTWYRGNAIALLVRENPMADPGRAKNHEINGHAGAVVDTQLAKPIQRWLGHGRTLRAVLWYCDVENAVYHVATHTGDPRPFAPDSLAMRCCKWQGGTVSRDDR